MAIAEKSILIVDDEETIRWVLNRKLSKEGYQCQEAGDAEQAMDRLAENPSELVLLDINMPGKQGDELLPELRNTFPETGVIMASGVTDTQTIARCISNGAQDYLCKPFKLEDVLLSVDMSLEKKRLETRIQNHEANSDLSMEEKLKKIRKYFLGAIENLVCSLEANDHYTAGHSRRVMSTALAIGRRLGLSENQLEDLRWGSLLHDVGKVAIDNSILNKPDKLTPEEYRYIMTHAIVGPNLVRPIANEAVTDIILHHHDRYDGAGLDQAVKGKDIPMGARIVATADSFDAMTSNRPYREAMPRLKAFAEIAMNSGTQFDPLMARTLLEISAAHQVITR